MTSKLLKQSSRYRYNKLCKVFSKFYYRHSELIVKYIFCLNTPLQQGISEPVSYDFFYELKLIVGKPRFSDQFKKNIITRYKKRDTTWKSCEGLYAW